LTGKHHLRGEQLDIKFLGKRFLEELTRILDWIPLKHC
jgi:hypothetical protein